MAQLTDGNEYSKQFETKREAWVLESESIKQKEMQHQQIKDESGSSTTGDATIKINSFTQARIDEMVSAAECLSVAVGGKRVFQMLPPHMRRRAMSHKPNRVPRRIREAHQREVEKSEAAVPSKRPSRKHRRRPKNLLEEYNRRKQNHIWLETHIWHAKRFKMERHWGYNIPIHRRDKGVRAAHRSVAEGTLLQDISFYNCIELCGTQEEIITGFCHLTSVESSLTPAAKSLLDGSRQGSGMLYHKDAYPYAAIGPYQFHWKSFGTTMDVSVCDVERTLWIWVHPAIHNEVVKELESIFSLRRLLASKRPHPDATDSLNKRVTKKMKLANQNSEMASEIIGDHNKKTKSGMPATSNLVDVLAETEVPTGNDCMSKQDSDQSHMMPFNERTPTYVSATMTMVLLRDTLVRFRLRGPQSIATLSRVLKPAQLKVDDTVVNGELQSDIKSRTTDWWKSYYATQNHMSSAQTQNDIWEKMQKEVDGAQLPPNCILGLIVRDPRLLLPSKRTESSCTSVRDPAQTVILNFPSEASVSPFWDAAIRDEVTYKRIDLATLNRMRSQSLVPGTPLELGSHESRIPVMLVQNRGSSTSSNGRLGYGSGFDLILPSAWGMAFWVALVFNGARASGTREAESTELQQGSPVFPNHFPDTAAGKDQEKVEEANMMTKYERRPPAKRVSFPVLGIAAPFAYPWLQLVQEWAAIVSLNQKPINDFYILRHRRALIELQSLCSGHRVTKKNCIVFKHDCLVGVHLEMMGKGMAQAHSTICLPTLQDLDSLFATGAKSRSEWSLKESHKVNPIAKERKEQRASVRTLRQKRKKCRQKIRVKTIGGEPDTNVKHLQEQLTWLYPKPAPLLPTITQVVKSCDRDIIGFVIAGEFSYSLGKVTSRGFCSMAALGKLIELTKPGKRPLVLVRETCTDHYKAAWLSITLA